MEVSDLLALELETELEMKMEMEKTPTPARGGGRRSLLLEEYMAEKKMKKMILEKLKKSSGDLEDLKAEKKMSLEKMEKSSGDLERYREKKKLSSRRLEEYMAEKKMRKMSLEKSEEEKKSEAIHKYLERYMKGPEDKTELNEYIRQMVSSGGFDIEFRLPYYQCSLFPLKNLEEGSEQHKELCDFSILAITKFNTERATHYQFFKYVKAVYGFCSGVKYYITFEAKEPSHHHPTTFQALVYRGISTPVQVTLVRKKSEATQEDNSILLC